MGGEVTDITDVHHIKRQGEINNESTTLDEQLSRKISHLFYNTNQNNEVAATACLKPSDTVVILKPLSGREPRASRVLLVYRFWIENDEDNVHALYLEDIQNALDGYSEPTTLHINSLFSSFRNYITDKMCSVLDITLHRTGGYNAFLETPETARSTGYLSDGTPFAIYRFILYWDGFRLSTRTEASGCGIYISNLNLPIHMRTGVNSVRVLTFAPPGCSENSVLPEILPDLEIGMTKGFDGVDVNGNSVKIFLDLVACVADTPAVSKVLNSVGHTGIAGCHLCRYQRGRTSHLICKYGKHLRTHEHCACKRTIWKYNALTDSDASESSLKKLGFSSREQLGTRQPLHIIAEQVYSWRFRIPKTNESLPVVSAQIDPYQSCIIAPDHVLVGYFRDCSSMILEMLHPAHKRLKVEQVALKLLRKSGLNTQHKILSPNNRKLLSMTSSQSYALSSVFSNAVIRVLEEYPQDSFDPASNCFNTVDTRSYSTSLEPE